MPLSEQYNRGQQLKNATLSFILEVLKNKEEKEMKALEPFDLKRALEGEPICTVKRWPVVIDCIDLGTAYPIIGTTTGTAKLCCRWSLKGESHPHGHGDYLYADLRMEPKPKVVSPDSNVEAIRDRLLQRSQVGFEKYGVTTERKDLDVSAWLRHLQEELLDAAVYIEAALQPVVARDEN